MHQAPSRGALAGIKEDIQKAKQEGYAPNGVGNAYSHNFLNQKPWHPANFRNQAKVYEAQQAKLAEEKRKHQAKAEFEAEQEYLQTLSFLGPEEEKKYRERQSVQFLYMKPPGASDEPLQKMLVREDVAPEVQASQAAPSGETIEKKQTTVWRDKPAGQSHLGNMLSAVRALQDHETWSVRHIAGSGQSPPRGEGGGNDENHRMLLSSPEPDATVAPDDLRKRKRRQATSKEPVTEESLQYGQAGQTNSPSPQHRQSKKSRKNRKEKKKKKGKRKKES